MGATTLTSHDGGSSKEGDATGRPFPARRGDHVWPTLVVESGVSMALSDLRTAIK